MNEVTAKELLGMNSQCSLEDLKRAYRNHCKKHHPDAGGSEKQFHQIQEAYEVLSTSPDILTNEVSDDNIEKVQGVPITDLGRGRSGVNKAMTDCDKCNGNGWRYDPIALQHRDENRKEICHGCGGMGEVINTNPVLPKGILN